MMPIAKDVEDNTVKTLIANLFVNASYKDFADPVSYIERRIDFLKDKTFSNYDNGVIDFPEFVTGGRSFPTIRFWSRGCASWTVRRCSL